MSFGRMRGLGLALLGVAGLAGCAAAARQRSAPPPVPSAARPMASAASPGAAEQPLAASESPASGGQPIPCGALGCVSYPDVRSALEHVLTTSPRVLAVGEAHALEGTEAIESTVSRFGRLFLPILRDKASDLVLELLVPEGRCEQVETQVRREQRAVTEVQAKDNQNEYVALGHQSRALGITPYPLRPTCEELTQIARAGDDAVIEMLRAITHITVRTVRSRLTQAIAKEPGAMVIAYGGAMHNDLFPRPDRERFTFGPELFELTEGRYVELDLIVPEFIKDTDSWRSLEWYAAFDPEANPRRVTLFNPRPGVYVLIFPRTR